MTANLAPLAPAIERRPRMPELVGDWVRTEVGRTPGRLRLWSVAIVVLALAATVALLLVVTTRRAAVHDLWANNGPLLVSAQAVHTSLLEADAAASNAFLAGGIEPADQRQRYEAAITRAAEALAEASQRADQTGPAHDAIVTIARLLPQYTGLIESARANNRQGFPVGAAYLNEASTLVRTDIVTSSRQFEQAALDGFKSRYGSLTNVVPIVVLILLLVALAPALAGVQIYLFRTTNRVLNLPLVAASAVVLVVAVWAAVTLGNQRAGADDAVDRGFRSVLTLADVRVQGFTAKTNESLDLIARGNGQAFRDEFARARAALESDDAAPSSSLLDRAVTLADGSERTDANAVRDAWSSYAAVHDQIEQTSDANRYDDAVALATGTAPGSSNDAFAAFDAASRSQLDANQTQFTRLMQSADAGGAFVWLAPLLAAVAIALALYGIQLRINEYR